MKTFLKILAGVVAAAAIVALIMIATRMDANTSFLEAGRKWIESIGDGIIGGKAAVEEYEEATDSENVDGSADDQDAGPQPGPVEFNDELTAVDENGDVEMEGGFSIEDDRNGGSPTAGGLSQDFPAVSADVVGSETVASEQESNMTDGSLAETDDGLSETETYDKQSEIYDGLSEKYDGLPGTYDEYLGMNRADRVALAELMGADFEPWLEFIKAHQDDGKIIIIATDQMETVE